LEIMKCASERPSAKENLLAALRGEKPAYTPVISVCQYGTHDLMSRTGSSWPLAHNNAAEMAALAAGGATVFDLDAYRVPYSQTVEAEALGAVVKDGGDRHLPSIAQYPCTLGEVPSLPGDFLEKGQIPQVAGAIRLLKQEGGGRTAVIGGICGPFSIAANLLGVATILKNAHRNPEAVKPFVELGLKAGIELARFYIEAGADIIAIEDMMASMTMISPKIYRDLVHPYEKELLAHIKAPTILHICGNLDSVITEAASAGASALSVDHSVNIPLAKEKLAQEHIAVPLIGAVHPLDALLNGSPEDTRKDTEKYLSQGIDIIAPGCALAPDTATENVLAMVEAGHGFSSARAEK
jgi:[methyl-Co(III) methanol-specific corrinoid protein]:coenzyme M methyltransferase